MKRLGFLAGSRDPYVGRAADDGDTLVLDVLAGYEDPAVPMTVVVTIKVDDDGWIVVEHERPDGKLVRGYAGMIDLDNAERPFTFNVEPHIVGLTGVLGEPRPIRPSHPHGMMESDPPPPEDTP